MVTNRLRWGQIPSARYLASKPAYFARYCPKEGAKLAKFAFFCAVLRRFIEAFAKSK
jgi:hypothetical protein